MDPTIVLLKEIQFLTSLPMSLYDPFHMDMLLAQYLPVALFLVIVFGFGAVTLVAGRFLRPKNTYPEKLLPYESGIDPETDARQPFPLRYYLMAMLFVIFDIEVVFIYPWAVTFRELGGLALVEMVVFLGILSVGYVYAWGKGALEWD